MFDRPNPARPNSVLKREDHSTERSPTQTLTHFAPVQMVALQFGDASGRTVTTVGFKVGDKWYMDRNGEKWAKDLMPMAGWLSKQLDESIAVQQAPKVPEADAVDLFPKG